MTAEKQKTASKRHGPLNRWRTSASLGSQRAGILVHLRFLWITCTKTTRLSEKDPFRSQQNFPNTVSGDPAGPWPWSLADSFMISVRKGHVPRRTKLALGSLTRVRATCIFNELPEALPSNTDRNTAVTQSHRYRHQKSNENTRPGHDLMYILPRVIHPRTPDRTRPSLHSL